MGAGAAYADDDYNCRNIAQDKRVSAASIEEKAKGMGFDVLRVGMDDGCFEVKAVDMNGDDFDVYFHPETAKVIGVDD
ncbi:MAG: PepSY domain-containing protein [Rhizobiaceae bacterium]|nr:MAG: PepSY domain-containing protein [Rhizobiaceae bacterium]